MWQVPTLLAWALLFLLVRPVRAQLPWPGRTTHERAATTATSSSSTTTSGSRRSRGSTEGDTTRVTVVHRTPVVVTSKTNLDEVEHPDRFYVEHHPYASGVFAFDPNLEINCMH
jgi:hypothetical protein